MIWLMVVVYSSPGGDLIMRSYHEYQTKEVCIKEAEHAKSYPHPFGLKVDITCKQAVITLKD